MVKLNNDLSLAIEMDTANIRLVVYKQANEFVCRKCKLSELRKLIETDNTHLFKGRLQLYRSDRNITIEVKKEQIGWISLEQFQQMLIS
jgi:hypothetical protein